MSCIWSFFLKHCFIWYLSNSELLLKLQSSRCRCSTSIHQHNTLSKIMHGLGTVTERWTKPAMTMGKVRTPWTSLWLTRSSAFGCGKSPKRKSKVCRTLSQFRRNWNRGLWTRHGATAILPVKMEALRLRGSQTSRMYASDHPSPKIRTPLRRRSKPNRIRAAKYK